MNTGDSVEMTWPFFPDHPEPMGEGAKVSPDAKGPEQVFRFGFGLGKLLILNFWGGTYRVL